MVLLITYSFHFVLHIIKAEMGVCIQGDADIRRSHDVLQGFGIHSGLCHVGAECMSANMGGNFGELYFVNAVILFPDVLKILLPVQRYHRHIVFIQKRESWIAVNHGFCLWRGTHRQNMFKTIIYVIHHRNKPCATGGFGILNDVIHMPVSLQLVIHINFPVFEIKVRYS